jgi:nucleotide-binding universal stress UspA family protein
MSQAYKIVAAIDADHTVEFVLKRALEIAAAHPSVELHALAVSELVVAPAPMLMPGPGFIEPRVDPKRVVTAIERAMQNLRDDAARTKVDRVEIHHMLGRPADEIVWFAAHCNADAIVMGTHGRRGLRRMLLGSVAEKVVRLAGCPVYVVREKSHDPSWAVPEIEPVCDECAKARAATNGEQLWCARHSERHVRAHVYSSSRMGGEAPHAWSSSTGT